MNTREMAWKVANDLTALTASADEMATYLRMLINDEIDLKHGRPTIEMLLSRYEHIKGDK